MATAGTSQVWSEGGAESSSPREVGESLAWRAWSNQGGGLAASSLSSADAGAMRSVPAHPAHVSRSPKAGGTRAWRRARVRARLKRVVAAHQGSCRNSDKAAPTCASVSRALRGRTLGDAMRRGRGLRSSGVTMIGQAKSATLRRGLHVVPASCTSVLLLWEPYMRPYGALSAPVRLSSAPVSIIREKRSSSRHRVPLDKGAAHGPVSPRRRVRLALPTSSLDVEEALRLNEGQVSLYVDPEQPPSPPAANAAAMPSPQGTHRRMLDELDPIQRRGQAMGGGADRRRRDRSRTWSAPRSGRRTTAGASHGSTGGLA